MSVTEPPSGDLRYGWTTGACATAATKAALTALLTGAFPDPVTITLPKGQMPSFALAEQGLSDGVATAGVVKDAGDDPDVTHGALVLSSVQAAPCGSGIQFRAGDGVGTITKKGLPLPPGEPAINPVPRSMMTDVVTGLCERHEIPCDFIISISIEGGLELAAKTWNPRLGIVGGLSVLGTTGVVVPYSCSAWIHSIHRGIDVARAEGMSHVGACTGNASEQAVMSMYGLDEGAMLDMGDFAGGVLKYLNKHPVPRLTIGGGFGKLCKLAQGALDLHSSRSQVDFPFLGSLIRDLGGSEDLVTQAVGANTANEVLGLAQGAGLPLAQTIAGQAQTVARSVLKDADIDVDVIVINRDGTLAGKTSDNIG